LLADRAEKFQLAAVEIFAELDIGAPYSPIVRQLDREIVAMLTGLQVAAAPARPA
jgi:hypothetical protein